MASNGTMDYIPLNSAMSPAGDGDNPDYQFQRSQEQAHVMGQQSQEFLLGKDPDCKIGLRPTQRKSLDETGTFGDRIVYVRQIISHLILLCILLLIGVQMGTLGAWIYLYSSLQAALPPSFGWKALLNSFGSVPYTCETCNSSERQRYSLPYIPILGFALTLLGALMMITFVCFHNCRKIVVFYTKQLLFIDGLFVILAGSAAASFLFYNLDALEAVMREVLTRPLSPNNLSDVGSIWETTQIKSQCCGVFGYKDWYTHDQNNSETFHYPDSCCTLRPCQRENVHLRGCYSKERETALTYGIGLILAIFSILPVSAIEYILSKVYLHRVKESKVIAKSSGHRIFMRHGSNFVLSGGHGKNCHLIRKDGVLVETKGALAESTAINDHHISLEMLTFFSASDIVGVTRQPDRILVVVSDKVTALERGSATITCSDDRHLDNIIVTPTANGIINIRF